MAIQLDVRLYTPEGQFVASLNNIVDADGPGLEYVIRSDGGIGALSITIPRGALDQYLNWQNVDYKIGVWRSINGAPYVLDNNAFYFIRGFEYTNAHTKVTAYHALELLVRRVNAYRHTTFNNYGPQQSSWGGTAITTDAFKVTYAGNLMKGIVRQNYSFENKIINRFGLYDTAQRWNAQLVRKTMGTWTKDLQLNNLDLQQYIEIEPEKNDGISTAGIDCNGGVVYELLQQIQQLSIQGDEEDGIDPIYLTFDLQAIDEKRFIFRTFQNQYGKNRGDGLFIFSPYRGNFADPKMTIDRSEESNIMYSMDKDENIVAGINRRRAYDSIFNIREAISIPEIKEKYYKRSPKTSPNSYNMLKADAFMELRRRLPRVVIEGKAVPTPQSIRGIHWDVGDIVTCEFRGFRDNYRITAVNVSVTNNNITEDVQFEKQDFAGFGVDISDDISPSI